MNKKDETLEIAGDIERTAINSFQHNTGNKGHKKFVAKSHGKRSSACSQLKAITITITLH